MSDAIFETLSLQQQQDLKIFAQRLEKQNRSLNMVSPSTIADLWSRHIWDSLQLVPHIQDVLDKMPPKSTVTALDMGTGGGLPAVPLAIAFAQNDKISLEAIDSNKKKISAIRIMTLGLGMSLKLNSKRIENHKLKYRILVSRALAPLSKLLEWSQYCLETGGTILLLKGESYRQEIESAQVTHDFHVTCHPSITNPSAAVLVVSDIRAKL